MNVKEKVNRVYQCTLERTGTNETAESAVAMEKFRRFCDLAVHDLLDESPEDLCTFASYALNLLIANPERGIPYYRHE